MSTFTNFNFIRQLTDMCSAHHGSVSAFPKGLSDCVMKISIQAFYQDVYIVTYVIVIIWTVSFQ